MNPHALIKKLQLSLSRKGRRFTVNQRQFYMQDSGKLLTKYTIVEQREGEKNITHMETYSLIAVLQYLADVSKEGAE